MRVTAASRLSATAPEPVAGIGGRNLPMRRLDRLPALVRHNPVSALATAVPRARLSLRVLSFIALVVLPTALAAVYLFAVAADQYVAEFRFTLSTADAPRLDAMSLLTGNSVQTPAALESQILMQYITSRAIVDQLDRALDLRRLFAPPQADWWSRLPQPAPIEEVVRYWKQQVDPFYDPSTGTVTVEARAFSAADAFRVAQAIGSACEKIVNDLSLRARRDMLQQSESELTLTENRLASVLGDIRAFRDREGMLDPAKTADSDSLLATRLRDELVDANAKLATLKAYMRDDAPTVKVLKARIRSLEVQRRALTHQMTGGTQPAEPPALSGVLGSYEQLESKRKFAEAAYQMALRSVDEAHVNADRQHVFVASFIPPSLPEEALYPRRWRSLGVVALMSFAIWAIGGLAAQSVRDHLW